MHDSNWFGKAPTLSLIGYTSTREPAERNSDWLHKLLLRRIDFME